eukprot:COSAG02_NODE_103_length_36570_cov_25.164487_4_plen_228_part_00
MHVQYTGEFDHLYQRDTAILIYCDMQDSMGADILVSTMFEANTEAPTPLRRVIVRTDHRDAESRRLLPSKPWKLEVPADATVEMAQRAADEQFSAQLGPNQHVILLAYANGSKSEVSAPTRDAWEDTRNSGSSTLIIGRVSDTMAHTRTLTQSKRHDIDSVHNVEAKQHKRAASFDQDRLKTAFVHQKLSGAIRRLRGTGRVLPQLPPSPTKSHELAMQETCCRRGR